MKKTQKTTADAPIRRRPPRPKVKMAELHDAVVDGKLVVDVGDKVFFERIAPKGKMVVHEGVVKSVDPKGLVEIWDETKEQFYCFNLNQPLPVVKCHGRDRKP
jgi:hypothetical protein